MVKLPKSHVNLFSIRKLKSNNLEILERDHL
jgi:hypothetical protein